MCFATAVTLIASAQALVRVLDGRQIPASRKVLSLLQSHTRVIPRHKGGAAMEFGRSVVLGDVDGGIVNRFDMLAAGESHRH